MRKMSPGQIEDRYARIVKAWEELAPTKSFGGMTLAQYRAKIAPSQAARAQIEALQLQIVGFQEARDAADQPTLEASDDVVKSVRADKSVGGDDGALYKAMGFVPKSERKTGLTRKTKPSGDGEA